MSLMSMFSENSRVKIPAIVHMTRLGYGYLSLGDPNINSQIDHDTNIFQKIFIDSLVKINSTNTPPATLIYNQRSLQLYQSLKSEELDSDDLAESFYDALLHGKDSLKLIDLVGAIIVTSTSNTTRKLKNMVGLILYLIDSCEWRQNHRPLYAADNCQYSRMNE